MFVAVTDPENVRKSPRSIVRCSTPILRLRSRPHETLVTPKQKRKTCEPRCTWLRIFMKRPYTYLLRAGPAEVLLKVRRFSAIQNVLLACRAVGLGASLTTAHRGHGEAIDQLIGLDPIKTPSIALIPVGWPRGRYGKPTRRSIDTCFFVDSASSVSG